MPGPPVLEDIEDGGPIKYPAGDPFSIEIAIEGADLTNMNFQAQIRQRDRDAVVITEFSITRKVEHDEDDVPTTVLTLNLAGDSAPGAADGQSRLGSVRKAAFDVQMWGLGGAAATIAEAELAPQQDVTR